MTSKKVSTLFLWKTARRQTVHWYNPGMWGWSTDGGSQSNPGFLKSILWEYTPDKQTPVPHPLIYINGFQSEEFSSIIDFLYILRRSKCLPKGLGFFPCHCWRDQANEPDWTNFKWAVREQGKPGRSDGQRCVYILQNKPLAKENQQHLIPML